MNGLTTVNASSVNSDTINATNAYFSGFVSVPTVTPSSTADNRAASTSFVQNAISFAGSNFATLSGINTFTNINNFSMARGASSSSQVAISDTTGSLGIQFNPNATSGALNGLVNTGDSTIVAVGPSQNSAVLTLSTWSSTTCGFKATNSLTRMRAGANWFLADSTANQCSVTGNLVLNGKVSQSLSNLNVQYGDLNTFPTSITGANNSVFGADSGTTISTGSNNVIVGTSAGKAITTAQNTVIIGSQTGSGTMTVGYNQLIGVNNTTRIAAGQSNFIAGYNSCLTYDANDAIVIGRACMRGDLGATTYTPTNIIAIGTNALFKCQTTDNVLAVGHQSAYNTTTGSRSVNVGSQAGYSNTTGSQNVNVGYISGYTNVTGSNNTCIGYGAGAYGIGSSCTFLGHNSGQQVLDGSTYNYLTTIGEGSGNESSVCASNRVILGSSTGNEDLLLAGNPKITAKSTTTAVNLFNTSTGTINIGGAGANSVFSGTASCATAPTLGSHLCNKTYVDSIATNIYPTNNTWTGTNTYQNNVLIKNTAGTAEYFEVKQSVSGAPSTTISRVGSAGGSYNTIHSFTNVSGYVGRCIITIPIAIYNAGTGAGGSGTTFSVTLSALPYQILKNGASYVSPSTPAIVGGTLPDTKTLQLTGTGSYACEVYICEISISFEITSAATDTYAIQINYSGSTSLPSSTNTYISAGSVSTFQAVSGTISMTSSPNTGYLTPQFYSSPLYNPSLTMGSNGYCALPRNVNICPCGTIIQSLARIPPYGFLLANGATVNISDYPDLFGLIQYDYGYGVYGVSFKLPNLNGAFLRSAGSQTYSGITYDGGNVGAFQQDQTLPIKQQGFYNLASGTARSCPSRFSIPTDPVDTGVSTFSDRMGNEVRPFNFSVYYYIKY